jgi:hypothetical protein
MNAQERMIDRRTFRIAAIAVAAVAVLVLAAYLFGNGLRADTSALGASSADVRAAALAAQAQRRADFYADQKAAAEAARWAAAAADPYNQEWMGFTSPESVGARLPSVAGAGASGSPSIKPEGIKTDGVLFAAPAQYQWIKPEGITTSGTK